MATTVTGLLPAPWAAVVWTLAPMVALGRLYVGAHLPLDIVGGAALGGLLGSGARLVARQITARSSVTTAYSCQREGLTARSEVAGW